MTPSGARTQPCPGPTAFHAFEDLDKDVLLRSILALGAEIWVLADRLHLLEQALASEGIDVSPLVEELSRQPEHAAGAPARRDAFLARVLGPIERAVG